MSDSTAGPYCKSKVECCFSTGDANRPDRTPRRSKFHFDSKNKILKLFTPFQLIFRIQMYSISVTINNFHFVYR